MPYLLSFIKFHYMKVFPGHRIPTSIQLIVLLFHFKFYLKNDLSI